MVEEEEEETPTEETKEEEEINPVEEAKSVLAETKKALQEIKKERQKIEKATADSLINGKSFAGQNATPKISPEEIARNARIKAVGQATGAQWAKDKDGK